MHLVPPLVWTNEDTPLKVTLTGLEPTVRVPDTVEGAVLVQSVQNTGAAIATVGQTTVPKAIKRTRIYESLRKTISEVQILPSFFLWSFPWRVWQRTTWRINRSPVVKVV